MLADQVAVFFFHKDDFISFLLCLPLLLPSLPSCPSGGHIFAGYGNTLICIHKHDFLFTSFAMEEILFKERNGFLSLFLKVVSPPEFGVPVPPVNLILNSYSINLFFLPYSHT